MNPWITADGWLRVTYDGPELAVIEIELPGTGWLPAYLGYGDRGERVAQVRWDGPVPGVVNLRVNGVITGSYP